MTGTGCSAIWARTRISDAKDAVETAHSVGAEKKAAYQYAAALLYLEKAREEEAYAYFGPAIEFADLSADFAEKARSKAVGENKAETKTDAPPPPAPEQ